MSSATPPTEIEPQTRIVSDSEHGLRLDQAMAELFPDYSRSRLTAWIKSGRATIDGVEAKPKQAVTTGQRITLIPEPEAQTDALAESIALDVVFEDNHVLVINKPAGLVVHPGAGNPGGTLMNALLHHDPKLRELPRAGIVHRLDKETSGCLVIAKNLPAHTSLVSQLAEREISRRYQALVYGEMIAGGRIDKPIDRNPYDRLRQAVREDGKEAITHYRVAERLKNFTLLECQLETGRTHQIRVHLAHIRHGIVGDPLYGLGLKLPKGASPELIQTLRGFKRQALHAAKLEFEHPKTHKLISVEAPLPADFQALLAAIRAG